MVRASPTASWKSVRSAITNSCAWKVTRPGSADLNDIVVHIFQQEMRELFRIESLWKQSHVLYGEAPDPSHASENDPGNED